MLPPRSFGDAGRRRSKLEATVELGQRQEFDRWTEEVCEDLARAQRGQDDLEDQLATAKEDLGILDRDLNLERRKCAELERQMQLAHSHASSQERDASQIVEENAALRKQCSANAVEIDRLREEERKMELELKELQARRNDTKVDHVTLMMKLKNINAERMCGSEQLQRVLKDAIQRGVVNGLHMCGERWDVQRGGCVEVQRVLTDTQEVRVQAAVMPPREENAHALMTRLSRQLPSMQSALNHELAGMEGSNILPGADGVGAPEVIEVILAWRCGACGDVTLQYKLEEMRRNFEAEQVAHEETKTRLKITNDLLQDLKNRNGDLHKDHQMTKDERRKFSELAQDLLQTVDELQDAFVKQTREYMKLVSEVRENEKKSVQVVDDSDSFYEVHKQCMDSIRECLNHARNASRDQAAECKHLLGEAEKYESRLHYLYNENRATAGSLRDAEDERTRREAEERERAEREAAARREKRRLWLDQQSRLIDPNFTPYLKIALHKDGVPVQKVQSLDEHKPGSTKPPKSDDKVLRVVLHHPNAKDAEPALRLQWKTVAEKQWKRWVDLNTIVLIGFGWNARAPRLLHGEAHADLEANRCLSVFSLHRSFDFVFAKDEDCQAFTITLSKLCGYMQGWPLVGGLSTRSKFLSARGWCKVQGTCMKKKRSMLKLLLEACQKVKAQRDAEDRVEDYALL